MSPELSAIEIEDLTHQYDGRRALDRLSFSIAPGESFGLLGPNGSGKTTLFRILSTLLVPTSGCARIYGMDIEQAPDDVRRAIGVVFQSSSVDGKLTVSENLRHQGHLYGLHGHRLRQRIREILSHFGLDDRAGDLVETLSGGLRRRVEIAKALLHRPAVLLLDEPSTGLDPGARRELWSYLETVRSEWNEPDWPTTIIVTTHLMDEAEGCSRLAILDQGRLVALDTPSRLKAQIGGDVIFAESPDAQRLREAVAGRFRLAPTLVNDTIRFERADAHAFVIEMVRAFPDLISAVTVRKPTLEDVFVQRTGHRFE